MTKSKTDVNVNVNFSLDPKPPGRDWGNSSTVKGLGLVK